MICGSLRFCQFSSVGQARLGKASESRSGTGQVPSNLTSGPTQTIIHLPATRPPAPFASSSSSSLLCAFETLSFLPSTMWIINWCKCAFLSLLFRPVVAGFSYGPDHIMIIRASSQRYRHGADYLPLTLTNKGLWVFLFSVFFYLSDA